MPDYFTLAELRAEPDMASTTKYPDARVELASGYVVGVIERETGTSFIPRTVTAERHVGRGTGGIILDEPYVRSVTSATIDGVAVTETLVAEGSVLYRLSGSTPVPWPDGGVVLVTYQAGYSDTPPADIKVAALQGTRAWLLENNASSGMDARRSQMTNELGGTTTFVMAGEDRDHPTGWPQVDATIVAWRDQLDVFGFA